MRTKIPLQSEKILDAAAHLFGTQRFHEVRMDDIAAEAGVGKGTLYRYFSDKDELYLALLQRSSSHFVDCLNQEVARAEGAQARLEALVAAIIVYFDERPHLLDLLQRAEVARGRGPEYPWFRTRDELIQLVLDLFEELHQEGRHRIRDPYLTALLLLGGIRSVLRFGEQPRPADLAQQIVSNSLYGALAAECSKSSVRNRRDD